MRVLIQCWNMTGPKGTGCEDIDWIHLAQYGAHSQALVNTELNLRVLQKVGNFLTSWNTVSFSRKALFHGVSSEHKFTGTGWKFLNFLPRYERRFAWFVRKSLDTKISLSYNIYIPKKSTYLRGCIQKFPEWPPGTKTANGTALRYYVQLYRYFVSQPIEFCCHNPLCCF